MKHRQNSSLISNVSSRGPSKGFLVLVHDFAKAKLATSNIRVNYVNVHVFTGHYQLQQTSHFAIFRNSD